MAEDPRREPEPNPVMDLLKEIRTDMIARFESSNKAQAKMYDAQTAMATKVDDMDRRLKEVEEKVPPSNFPPRTPSGFNKAVRTASQAEIDQIAQLAATVAEVNKKQDTQSAAIVALDKKTDDQNDKIDALEKRGETIEKKTDLQTATLNKILSVMENPMAKRVAYAAGGAAIAWLAHHGGLIP